MQTEQIQTLTRHGTTVASLRKAKERRRRAFAAARKGAFLKASKGKHLVRLAKPSTGFAALTEALVRLSSLQGSPTKISLGRKSASRMLYGDLRAVVEDTSRATRRVLANFDAFDYANSDRVGTADSERATERP